MARLSQTMCTSSPAGTFLSILARNFLNSAARWWRDRELMTVPSSGQIRPIMDLDRPVRRAIDAHLLPY